MGTDDEQVALERLTYLIVEKVGPHVLISYNLLRDKLKTEYGAHERYNRAPGNQSSS